VFKEGIPKLIGGTLKTWQGLSNQKRRQAIGNEYLNYEFGWKPLVSDLMSFCASVIDVHDTLRAYERDSSRMVRRRYDFPAILEHDVGVDRSNVSAYCSPSSILFTDVFQVNKGRVVVTVERDIRQWFSGAFTYYVPPSKGLKSDMQRFVIQARKAFGISLTPDTLWNLAPWSWAADWFSSTGDVLSNWTDWAIDNQVLLYGYVMEHTVHKYTFTFVGPTGFKPQDQRPPDLTTVTETKVRRQATPYGFGLSWDDFTSRQKAIVAALGISRSK